MTPTDDTIAALDQAISSRSYFHVGLYKDQLCTHARDAARRSDWRAVVKIQSSVVDLNRKLEAEKMSQIDINRLVAGP